MLNKLIAETNETEVSLDELAGLILPTDSSYEELATGITQPEDLANLAILDELYAQVMAYQSSHNLNYSEHGCRLIIEIPVDSWGAKTYITDKAVAPQNFSDWLKPKHSWKSELGEGQGGFFEFCAKMALQDSPQEINGASIEFLKDHGKTVFAVKDGSPKTPIHYLLMTTTPRDNILDPNLTKEEFHQLFQLAYQLFKDKAGDYQLIRIVFNNGQDYQRGTRLSGHLQFDNDILPFDPQDCNYEIDKETYCVKEDLTSELYLKLVEIIEHYNKAQNDQEKIALYHELKEFIYSRVMFH